MRGLAILLVVLAHAGLQNIVPGGLGVTIFFVISGFLITRQMIAEIEATKKLNLTKFYLRRVFRLAPALLFYVALFTAILLPLGSPIAFTHILSTIFYVANYYHIFIGFPDYSPFIITWSLAIEEHYYIVFPLLILLASRNLRALMPWLLAGTILALLWRMSLYQDCLSDPSWPICGLPGSARIAKGTDSVFDCILYGAIAALALQYHTKIVQRFLINRFAFISAALILFATFLWRDEMFRETLRYTLQSISIAILMLNILFGDQQNLNKILSSQILIFVGKISYSLYLFHFGVLILLQAIYKHPGNLQGPFEIIAYFIGSFGLAILSYKYVEQPIIKLRRRFGAHVKPA